MVAFVLADTPALPLHTAGKYVAAAYVVLFAVVLIYVAVMAIRLSRMERDLGELLALSERSEQESGAAAMGADSEQRPDAAAMGADPERESAPA
jgi:hypothetical protein